MLIKTMKTKENILFAIAPPLPLSPALPIFQHYLSHYIYSDDSNKRLGRLLNFSVFLGGGGLIREGRSEPLILEYSASERALVLSPPVCRVSAAGNCCPHLKQNLSSGST